MLAAVTRRLCCSLNSNRGSNILRNISSSKSVQYPLPQTDEKKSVEKLTRSTQQTINPLDHDDFFGVKELFTMKDLFQNRVYIGHKRGLRNEYMTKYLYGNRLEVDIIDLDQTLVLLQDALNFTAHIAFQKGIILFISRNRETMPIIEKTALDCGEYAHCRYWHGGVFTNSTIQFGAVTRLPDLCIFMNTQNNVFKQHAGIVNAAKMNIPSIGILDSNCDPRLITHPVPANDDTPCAVSLYCQLFKQAIMKGREKRNKMEHQGLV